MVVLTIETVGEEKIVRGFNRYVAKMKDFSPAFREIGEYFYKTEEKIFNLQGDPEEFQPLSAAYKKWKDRNFPGRKIMELRGRLKNSLIGKNQAEAQDTVRTIGKMFAEFGTRVPYAHRHQMGTHGMPKRKIVQLTETRKRVITKIVQVYAFESLQAEGF